MSASAISKQQLDVAVKALAKLDRPAAVAILASFGCLTTPEIKTEDIAATYAAVIEALKKFDGVTP